MRSPTEALIGRIGAPEVSLRELGTVDLLWSCGNVLAPCILARRDTARNCLIASSRLLSSELLICRTAHGRGPKVEYPEPYQGPQRKLYKGRASVHRLSSLLLLHSFSRAPLRRHPSLSRKHIASSNLSISPSFIMLLEAIDNPR